MGKPRRIPNDLERDVARRGRALRRAKARLGRKPDHPRNLSRLIAANLYSMGFHAMSALRAHIAEIKIGPERAVQVAYFRYIVATVRRDRAMWLRRGGRLP